MLLCCAAQAVWEELVRQQEAEHGALPVFVVPVSMVWDRRAGPPLPAAALPFAVRCGPAMRQAALQMWQR